MSWFAVGAAAVSAVVAISSSQNKSAKDAADQDQQGLVDDANAAQSIENMQAVLAQTSAQEELQRQQDQQYLGKQRASMGDNGTGSLGSGSNFDVGRQSAVAAETNALNLRYAGQLKANDYLQSAYGYLYGSDVSASNSAAISSNATAMAGSAALGSVARSYSGIASSGRLNSSPAAGTASPGSLNPTK